MGKHGDLAHPDLSARIAADGGLTEPNPATFCTPGPKGYTDHPVLAGPAKAVATKRWNDPFTARQRPGSPGAGGTSGPAG